jgi:hypothetical protein
MMAPVIQMGLVWGLPGLGLDWAKTDKVISENNPRIAEACKRRILRGLNRFFMAKISLGGIMRGC